MILVYYFSTYHSLKASHSFLYFFSVVILPNLKVKLAKQTPGPLFTVLSLGFHLLALSRHTAHPEWTQFCYWNRLSSFRSYQPLCPMGLGPQWLQMLEGAQGEQSKHCGVRWQSILPAISVGESPNLLGSWLLHL